ncbi:unnamed protein product [Darwinula stevensoni]|uniref:CARD domain-containing protein n=1 Tax=Darwinula stevensoni TaxID=69355 RepID=A0A7R9A9W2_9CRUS|nr:unnamed protein product [Darwinula stevensoni]CAG0897830.1 unnamed protein product [Darwinula stevensoni]
MSRDGSQCASVEWRLSWTPLPMRNDIFYLRESVPTGGKTGMGASASEDPSEARLGLGGRKFDEMSVSETILRRQWPIFLEYLDVDAISPILISKYVLPVDWMDNGEKPLRAREKREAILRIVRAKGRTGFQAFRKALAQVGQSHLVSSRALDALPSQKACLPLADDDAGVAAFMKGCSTTLKSPGTRRGGGTFGLSRLSSSSSF